MIILIIYPWPSSKVMSTSFGGCFLHSQRMFTQAKRSKYWPWCHHPPWTNRRHTVEMQVIIFFWRRKDAFWRRKGACWRSTEVFHIYIYIYIYLLFFADQIPKNIGISMTNEVVWLVLYPHLEMQRLSARHIFSYNNYWLTVYNFV